MPYNCNRVLKHYSDSVCVCMATRKYKGSDLPVVRLHPMVVAVLHVMLDRLVPEPETCISGGHKTLSCQSAAPSETESTW